MDTPTCDVTKSWSRVVFETADHKTESPAYQPLTQSEQPSEVHYEYTEHALLNAYPVSQPLLGPNGRDKRVTDHNGCHNPI